MNLYLICRRICIVLTVVLGSTVASSAAERSDSVSTSYLIGFHPLQLIANGLRVELEHHSGLGQFSLSAAPELYFGTFENASDNIMLFANHDNIDILGFGITMTGRYYVSEILHRAPTGSPHTLVDQQPYSNFYLFLGAEYRNVKLTYATRGWIPYIENGVEYYRFGDIDQTSTIQRIGAQLGIGNTMFFGDRFFMDFFLYTRITKAFQTQNRVDAPGYKDSYFTLTGNSFALGFRFGLLF
ncbi:MAG: hypothetical protein U0264_00980 [Candidatus Kapaibacterium sp.]